jgi:hypothetical protein
VTRDRARKKSVRAQVAASGEPYSVAARKLGRPAAAGEAARDEVITRVEATLAAASARIEVRKEMTVGPATAPAQDRHHRGPFRRLAGVAVRAGWDHVVPEQARTLLRTAFSGSALGVIEPSARRFQYVVFKQQHYSALAQMALGLDMTLGLGAGPAQSAYSAPGEDPLELLMRLRPATAARYAGEETVREARCRKIAVTAGGTPAVLTVWVDDEHVRQVQAVTSKKAKRVAVTVVATTTVTAQLWDFGVPVDSLDWRRPSALWSKLARRPAWTTPGRRRAIHQSRGAERPHLYSRAPFCFRYLMIVKASSLV